MDAAETVFDSLNRRDAQYDAAIRQIRDTRNYLQAKLAKGGADFGTAAELVVDRLSRFLADAKPPFPPTA